MDHAHGIAIRWELCNDEGKSRNCLRRVRVFPRDHRPKLPVNKPCSVQNCPPAPPENLGDQAYSLLREKEDEKVATLEQLLLIDVVDDTTEAGSKPPSDGRLLRQTQISQAVERRVRLGKHSIEVRAQVARVIKIVFAAKDFVSPVASLDPVHVGLPWAGICLLLPVSLRGASHSCVYFFSPLPAPRER